MLNCLCDESYLKLAFAKFLHCEKRAKNAHLPFQ